MRWLPRYSSARILDFGCGVNIPMKAVLGPAGFTNVVYYDPLISPYAPTEFLNNSIAGYDFIICKHVIYYLKKEEVETYFRLFKRALSGGGRIMIEVHNGASFSGALYQRNELSVQSVFTEHSLRNLAETCGFRVIGIYGNEFKITGPKSFVWFLARKVWEAVLKSVYTIERGKDSLNPTIFTKNLIMLAERK